MPRLRLRKGEVEERVEAIAYNRETSGVVESCSDKRSIGHPFYPTISASRKTWGLRNSTTSTCRGRRRPFMIYMYAVNP